MAGTAPFGGDCGDGQRRFGRVDRARLGAAVACGAARVPDSAAGGQAAPAQDRAVMASQRARRASDRPDAAGAVPRAASVLPQWPSRLRGRAINAPRITLPDRANVPPAPSGVTASPAASAMANCASWMAVIRIDNAVPRPRGGAIDLVSATELVRVMPRPKPVAAIAAAIAHTGSGSTSSATPSRPAAPPDRTATATPSPPRWTAARRSPWG